ncbi:MAG: hypothetical protein M3179_13705 [Actinomycetota bacterium]|nr:hypothetical protein [Actinomycetota bacterium]
MSPEQDYPVIGSADGAVAVFVTRATDLVPGQVDTNAAYDVFLFEPGTGAVTLVSGAAGSATTTANGTSGSPRLSADGRFVVYESTATDLVTGQTDVPDGYDILLFDRITGANALVSDVPGSMTTTATNAGGSNFSRSATISADGAYVAFNSRATNTGTSAER